MTVADLLAALRSLQVVDLEHPRRFGDPVFPPHRPGMVFTLHRRHEPGLGERRTSAAGMLYAAEHAGTHIDAFVHQAWDLTLHGGVRVTPEVQTPQGFTRLGADTIPPIVARGVLVDLAAQRGGPLPLRTLVGAAEVAAAAAAQGVRIGAGDVVLVRTGNDTRWADPERYLEGPGMGADVSAWLADQEVLAVGADNVAWDLPGHVDEAVGSSLPGHVVLLVQRGVYIIENLNLAPLAACGAREFLFLCLPLKVWGGTASPVRPVALVLQPPQA
ncbi:MAG: cyclase family protein [Armatimonadota bacterium]|nr:cyclase family protein [Armatimonadota bacterium]MDR7449603.1 cyclase family protein [Armatimonadota bacterium]MDR7460358.1 cyclase family protein [Armatimonadota bacterium]MDR7488091.1 cyclase family protein [Armatimonadota bacterium]MDR7492126.1 cyclase family protein [Armatimonadota bacterium]